METKGEENKLLKSENRWLYLLSSILTFMIAYSIYVMYSQTIGVIGFVLMLFEIGLFIYFSVKKNE